MHVTLISNVILDEMSWISKQKWNSENESAGLLPLYRNTVEIVFNFINLFNRKEECWNFTQKIVFTITTNEC